VADAIDESHTFRHDGHPMLRLHVHNAHRRTNPWGVSLGKVTRDSKNKVDAAVGMVGAQLGRTLVLRGGKHYGPNRLLIHRWYTDVVSIAAERDVKPVRPGSASRDILETQAHATLLVDPATPGTSLPAIRDCVDTACGAGLRGTYRDAGCVRAGVR